jgi:hypothetical protein
MPRQRRIPLFALLACLLHCVLAAPSRATWPHDPTVNVPLCTAASTQQSPRSCSDGAGGAIVTWFDYRSGNYDVYVQRVSREGVPLWTANGVAVCTATSTQYNPSICADGAGGAVIAWQDSRSGNFDIYVQRVNASGAPQWTANGVALCTATESQQGPEICPDGTGGAIVAWRDLRTGLDNDIYVRRVNSSGTPQWTANGVALCTAAETQLGAQIASDGAGGAIVTWTDYRSGDANIYARRVSSAGAAQWAANGVALCDAALNQVNPVVAADGAGGAVVTWGDYRSGTNYDLYAQRVSASGSVLWIPNGEAVCTAADAQDYPDIEADGTGGFLVAWYDHRNGTDYNLYAQRLNPDGSALWTANGASVCTATGEQWNPHIAPDGTGGAIVTWTDGRGAGDFIYARRMSANGVAQWTSNGVALCTLGDTDLGSCIVEDGSGGAVVAWAGAHGLTNDFNVYAQRVDRFGALGEAGPTITAVSDVSPDQGGSVVVEWTASYLDAEPTFGIDAYSVWRQVPTSLATARLSALSAPGRPADEMTMTGNARPALRTTVTEAQTVYWEYVGSTPARGREGYSLVVATATDSIAGSNPFTRFMVSAEESGGTPYWDSAPDSGYSVDNLAPPTPQPFTGEYVAGTATLQWGVSPAPDFAAFRLHRGGNVDFVPSEANLIATTTSCSYVDAFGGTACYRLCALDVHGNASPFAMVLPNGAVDVPGTALPRELALSAPAPNPLRGSTTLRLALPRAARAAGAVYDQQGRHVRTLLAGTLPAGEHTIRWDGRDESGRDVPSGMYFVRCETEGRAMTRRIVALR